MRIGRRKALVIIGGGTILAAGVGSGVFLNTRTPEKALAPWRMVGGYKELRRRVLSWAILAPNPHNRQPWMVDLSQPDEIVLYVDTDKLLPETDPFGRQITIGLGCFLELLRMAAAQEGVLADITVFPQGYDDYELDGRPVASIKMVRSTDVEPDPLFDYALARRSTKEIYDPTRVVPDDALKQITKSGGPGAQIFGTNKMDQITELRRIGEEAMMVELTTHRTYKESVDLFRIGKAEIEANPDGIDLGGPLMDSLALFGLMSREAALDPNSPSYSAGIDAVMENVRSGMSYVWLVSDENSRIDQLKAGRDWLRINLTTTKLGIGLHPLSQPLQEYEEMVQQYDEIHKYLKAEGKTIQMLARMGYVSEEIPPSPRWPLESKIKGT